MSNPYRTPGAATYEVGEEESIKTQVLPDATLDELIFWEKMVIAVCSASDCKEPSTARGWATRMVLYRQGFPTSHR